MKTKELLYVYGHGRRLYLNSPYYDKVVKLHHEGYLTLLAFGFNNYGDATYLIFELTKSGKKRLKR